MAFFGKNRRGAQAGLRRVVLGGHEAGRVLVVIGWSSIVMDVVLVAFCGEVGVVRGVAGVEVGGLHAVPVASRIAVAAVAVRRAVASASRCW